MAIRYILYVIVFVILLVLIFQNAQHEKETIEINSYNEIEGIELAE